MCPLRSFRLGNTRCKHSLEKSLLQQGHTFPAGIRWDMRPEVRLSPRGGCRRIGPLGILSTLNLKLLGLRAVQNDRQDKDVYIFQSCEVWNLCLHLDNDPPDKDGKLHFRLGLLQLLQFYQGDKYGSTLVDLVLIHTFQVNTRRNCFDQMYLNIFQLDRECTQPGGAVLCNRTWSS